MPKKGSPSDVRGPRRRVEELLSSLADSSKQPFPQLRVICETVALLTRNAVQSCSERSIEKVFRRFHQVLNSFKLRLAESSSNGGDWLEGTINQYSLSILASFTPSRTLHSDGIKRISTQDCLGVGIDRRPTQTVDDKIDSYNEALPLRAWTPVEIHKFHTLYFGPCLGVSATADFENGDANQDGKSVGEWDVVVVLIRSMAILARSVAIEQEEGVNDTTNFNELEIVEAIVKFFSQLNSTCVNSLLPTSSTTRCIENWLSLVDFSVGVMLAIAMAGREKGRSKVNDSRTALLRKVMEHCESNLQQLIATLHWTTKGKPSSADNDQTIGQRVVRSIEMCFLASIFLLNVVEFPKEAGTEATDRLLSSFNMFIEEFPVQWALELVKNILKAASRSVNSPPTASPAQQLAAGCLMQMNRKQLEIRCHEPLRKFYAENLLLLRHLDRSIYSPTLLGLLFHLFPQVHTLDTLVKLLTHCPRPEATKMMHSPRGEGEEECCSTILRGWEEQFLKIDDVERLTSSAEQTVRIFDAVVCVLSPHDVCTFAHLLIRLHEKLSDMPAAPSPNWALDFRTTNVKIEVLRALSRHLARRKDSTSTAMLAEFLSNALNSLHVQEITEEGLAEFHQVLFELLATILFAAGSKEVSGVDRGEHDDLIGSVSAQFGKLMSTISTSCVPLVRMAQTDIWVMVTAEREFDLLLHFIRLFRRIATRWEQPDGDNWVSATTPNVNADDKDPQLQEVRSRILTSCEKLFEVCLDFLQAPPNATTGEVETETGIAEIVKSVERVGQMASTILAVELIFEPAKFEELSQRLGEIVGSAEWRVAFTLIECLLNECHDQEREQHCDIGNQWSAEELAESGGLTTDDEHSQTGVNSSTAASQPPTTYDEGSSFNLFLKALSTLTSVIESTWDEGEKDEVINEQWHHRIRSLILPMRYSGLIHSDTGAVKEHLFRILDYMACTNRRSQHSLSKGHQQTIDVLLGLVAEVLSYRPDTKYLTRLFPLCYFGSAMAQSVTRTLQSLVDSSCLEPSDSFLFPAPAPLDERIKTVEQPRGPDEISSAVSLRLDDACSTDVGECSPGHATVSFWVKLCSATDDDSSYHHLVTIAIGQVVLRAEVKAETGTVRTRVHYGGNFITGEHFDHVVNRKRSWFNVTLGLQHSISSNEVQSLVVVGNHVRVFSKIINDKLAEARDENGSRRYSCELRLGFTSGARREALCAVSTLFVFKTLLSADHALLLRSFGPTCVSLATCKLSAIHSAVLTQCISKSTICSRTVNVRWLLENTAHLLNEIQDSLKLTIRPSDHPWLVIDDTSATSLASVRLVGDTRACTLESCFETIGGVKIALFLYALSVDKGYAEGAQLGALHLLLSLLRRCPSFAEEFFRLEGPTLLAQILNSRSAVLDSTLCDELLLACFSKLERSTVGDCQLHSTPRTALIQPTLLQSLLTSAHLWRADRFRYWVRIVDVLSDAVSSPKVIDAFRELNRRQLIRADFLRSLLNALLEMFQTKASYGCQSQSADRTTSRQLFALIAELMGQPSRFNEVSQLWNFILLSHPAHDTYLDYSIRSHTDWLRVELLEPGEAPRMNGHSELSDFLCDVLDELGGEEVARLWGEVNNSTIAVRRKLITGEEPIVNASRGGRGARGRAEEDARLRFCRILWLLRNSVEHPPRRPECLHFTTDDAVTAAVESTMVQSEKVSPPSREPSHRNVPCEDVQSTEEHWLVQLRIELLQLISDIVLNSDDSLMKLIEEEVLHWQTILVLLSKQSHARIRVLTFTLLKNFLLRCSSHHRASFVQNRGFLLLSNELRQWNVSNRMADALFSLTCGEHVRLRDGLDTAHLEKITYDAFKLSSLRALYALLEESLRCDASLFWSVCSTLQKMFTADNAPRRVMMEGGLVKTMVNVLHTLCDGWLYRVGAESPAYSLLECWVSFAQSILIYIVPYRDTISYSLCEDFIWLCMMAAYQQDMTGRVAKGKEANECASASVSGGSSSAQLGCIRSFSPAGIEDHDGGDDGDCPRRRHEMRKALSQLLYCWVDCIQATLSDQLRHQYYPHQQQAGRAAASNGVDMLDESEEYEEAFFPESQWQVYNDVAAVAEELSATGPVEFASLGEIARRLMFGLTMIRNFFLYLMAPQECCDQEETLFRSFIETVLMSSWRRKPAERLNDDWQSVLEMCKEKARVILAELIAFTLFPAEEKCRGRDGGSNESAERIGEVSNLLPYPLRRRLMIVRYLAREIPQNRQHLADLLEVNLDHQYALKLALNELALLPSIARPHAVALSQYEVELERLIKFLRSIQIESPLANLTRDEISSLANDEILLLHSYHQSKSHFCEQLSTRAMIICEEEDALLQTASDRAMTLTCEINNYQNTPRKAFIQWRKELVCKQVEAVSRLNGFIRLLCHPLGPFHHAGSWSVGRALDPTESTNCRERRRFRHQSYDFPTKFLQQEQRQLAESASAKGTPLESLMAYRFKREIGNAEQGTPEHAEAVKNVRLSISATLLRTAFECSGEVVLTSSKLYFLGESAKSCQKGSAHPPVTYSWSYAQLRELHPRHYLLKDTALEIFTTTGDAYLLAFSTGDQRNMLAEQLSSMCLGVADLRLTSLPIATQMWRCGTITNFEYLTILNKLAGRSYNDLMQYPVFPFVLAHYSKSQLDLRSAASYRDLSRPMAIQDAQMELVYQRNYQSLLDEWERQSRQSSQWANRSGTSSSPSFSSVRFGAYHYGSHYSNTGIVAHYLVRVRLTKCDLSHRM